MTSPIVLRKNWSLLIVEEGCPVDEEFQIHSSAVSRFGRVQSGRVRGASFRRGSSELLTCSQGAPVPHGTLHTRKWSANTITTRCKGFYSVYCLTFSFSFFSSRDNLPLTATAEMSARSVVKGWGEVLKGEDPCRRREVWFFAHGHRGSMLQGWGESPDCGRPWCRCYYSWETEENKSKCKIWALHWRGILCMQTARWLTLTLILPFSFRIDMSVLVG